VCRRVGPVLVRVDITPAKPLHTATNWYRPVHPDTPVFPFWEQDAGSSNLPTPTEFRGICCETEDHKALEFPAL
jgi:hypothetical protein